MESYAETCLSKTSERCGSKQRLIETRSGDIQQSVIDQAIDQWRERLNVCVKARGEP